MLITAPAESFIVLGHCSRYVACLRLRGQGFIDHYRKQLKRYEISSGRCRIHKATIHYLIYSDYLFWQRNCMLFQVNLLNLSFFPTFTYSH